MTPEECPSWEGCSAPLCPLEPLTDSQWFPDEDICHSRVITKTSWIKTQRKIQRLFLKGRIDSETCFTIPALGEIKAVRHPKGIRPEDMYRNGNRLAF